MRLKLVMGLCAALAACSDGGGPPRPDAAAGSGGARTGGKGGSGSGGVAGTGGQAGEGGGGGQAMGGAGGEGGQGDGGAAGGQGGEGGQGGGAGGQGGTVMGGAGGGQGGQGGQGGGGAGGAGGGSMGGAGGTTTPDAAVDMDMAPPAPLHACTELPRPKEPLRLVDPFPQLPAFTAPTAAVQAPGQPQYWYVTEQAGRVKRFANQAGVTSSTVVLDLSDVTDPEGDAGILAVAFHPNFAENGELYLGYALRGNPLRTRLSRFTSSNGGASFDEGSEEVLIEIPQPDPEKIHLNCDMHFGPDGYLWLGMGDGGFGEDERGEAQNLNSINGKILRIDVNGTGPNGLPYRIPADNPFVGRSNARGEVWAIGFRNPWRWRFDPGQPGVIWVGELGSDRREEINRVTKGGNYGWNLLEGNICITPPCDLTGLTPPWVEFKHSEGKSVTTGPVYRGSEIQSLYDRLLYGDFVSGHVWALPQDRSAKPELVIDTRLAIVSFGVALDNEIILVDYDGGRLHKVTTTPAAAPAGLPKYLSQTGCFGPTGQPVAKLVPYDVNSPLWSDSAAKRRWMALPAGGKITVGSDGDFDFPINTTLIKEFSVGSTKVETRLFVRHADGGWAGYSYAWNAAQTDAELVEPSSIEAKRTVNSAMWTHPTRYQCMACHTKEANYTLGPEIAQLNRDFAYPDGTRNQITHLQQAGLFASNPGSPASLAALPNPFGTASLTARARSYLHANCAGCHRPTVRFPGGMDLRYTTALSATRTCGVDATYGGFAGAADRVRPGEPNQSVLTRFMRTTTDPRMPLVGTYQVDNEGASLVEAWIDSLTSCP